MRGRRGATSLLCALAWLLVPAVALAQTKAPQPTPATNGTAFDLGNSKNPIAIEAEQGIEWQQTNHVYIARGNAKVKRGNSTVVADKLTAHYRPAAKSGIASTVAPAPASDASKENALDGGTEIYRVEADGHVHFFSDTQDVYGDNAIYDIDKGTLVVTGDDLKLVTKQDTVTARDSLEWYDKDQIAVARGDATIVREQKRMRADVVTATVVRDEKGAQHISRIDAQGNVVVTSQDQTGRGDSGVYNVDTGITTLAGHVRLTRGQNELRGQYAVVDMNKNISRLLAAPPSNALTAGPPGRVEGLIMPRQQSSQSQTKN